MTTMKTVAPVPGRMGDNRAGEAGPLAKLRELVLDRRAVVGVIGQGYVGFPLAQRAATCGFRTVGFDTDRTAVERARSLTTSDLHACTDDLTQLEECQVVLIAVPTPTRRTTAGFEPDLSAVTAAALSVRTHPVERGARLVVVESTYAPGTTRRLVAELVGRGTADQPRAIGYSPERIDPGNDRYDLVNIPKLVSGLDAMSAELTFEFYSQIVETVVLASSVEAAEAAKLLENVFRFVNITFMQEFDQYCDWLGIPSAEVVQLSATKPFGFMPFFAGTGIGGHCIAEDPYFLLHGMRASGMDPHILRAAVQNHESRAQELAGRIARASGSLKGKRLLIMGVTYKPDVADTRRSPAGELMNALEAAGAEVSFSDPHVKVFAGRQSVDLEGSEPRDYDLAVVATHHRAFALEELRNLGWKVFDPAVDLAPHPQAPQ